MMACLVGYTTIEAQHPAERRDKPIRKLAITLAGDRLLRIAHPLTPTSVQPLLLSTGRPRGHRMTPWNHSLAENTCPLLQIL